MLDKEDEAVARGNTKEKAKAGWIKSDVYIDIFRRSQIKSDVFRYIQIQQLKLDVV